MASSASCRRSLRLAFLIGLLCASCTGCSSRNPDPLEKVNRAMYGLNDGLDRYILKPISRGYAKITPRFVQTGITNFFDNLSYTNVIFNDLLQARFGPALGGVGRMGVNTTVGLLGTTDPATKWGLPAHGNDMGLTLGRCGLKSGPYLVLPLLGPSTLRDASNIPSRWLTDPLQFVSMTRENEMLITGVEVTNARTNADWMIRFRDQASIDPYVFTREAYLRYRENILHPGKPQQIDGDFYDVPDDTGPTTRPATQPSLSDAIDE